MAGTINNAALNNVYNYYLTSYAPSQSSSRYDTHKKSELKNVYRSIIKLNKDAPLYLSASGSGSREFAVGIKEGARSLRNTIASLGGTEETDILNKKSAYSGDEDILTAEYVGSDPENAETYTLEVSSLASGQQNLGKFLPPGNTELNPNTYSFDVGINDMNYEFQFNVNEGESNRDVQNRLSRLINNSNIGLKADILENDEGSSSLRISSTATGLPEGKELLFTISDSNTSKASGAVGYLGLDFTSRLPQNSSFLLDGEEFHSYNNEFTVGGQYKVQLKSANPEKAVSIGLKTDVESLAGNISQLIGGYNSFIKAASEFSENQGNSRKLTQEMSRLTRKHMDSLSALGLSLGADGTISVDEEALRNLSDKEDAARQLEGVRSFANSLVRKTDQVSLDPMQYVDRKVAAYKDPNAANYPNPYMTSSYSGMMFNSYC